MARASMKLCSISGAQTPSASWLLVSLSSSNSLESYFAIWELIVSDTPESRTASFPCAWKMVKNGLKFLALKIENQIWQIYGKCIEEKFNSTSHWLRKQSEFFPGVTQYCKTVLKCHLKWLSIVDKQLGRFYSTEKDNSPCWWWWRTLSRGSWGSCAPRRRWRWPSSWPGRGGGGQRAWGVRPCAASARPPSWTAPLCSVTSTLASAT